MKQFKHLNPSSSQFGSFKSDQPQPCLEYSSSPAARQDSAKIMSKKSLIMEITSLQQPEMSTIYRSREQTKRIILLANLM